MAVRAKFPQPDGRGILPRKWSADKLGGPLRYFAELVLKRLIQHGFPASYRMLSNGGVPTVVRFENELGETDAFLQALSDALEIVARRCRCYFEAVGTLVRLAGEWRLDLRFAMSESGKPVVVGAKFVCIAPPI